MSVRVRLTVAVVVLVAALAGLSALLAPGFVERALFDDLLDAGAARQAAIAGLGFEGSVVVSEGATVAIAEDGLEDGLEDGSDDNMVPELGLDVAFADALPIGDVTFLGDGVLDRLAPERLDELRDLSGSDVIIVSLGGSQFVSIGPAGPDSVFVADPVTLAQPVVGFDEIIALTFTDPFPVDAVGADNLDRLQPTQADEVPQRVISGVRAVDGAEYIVFAETASVERTVGRVSTALWSIVPLAVLVAGLATWMLAGRALKPVAAITAQTEGISGGTLDERVPVPKSNDEISKLAITMNGMLDRLEGDDRRRRRFVSDASHELRSPVAVMRSEAEVALRVPDQTDVIELATGMLAESTRMALIIDDLLALARHDEGLPVPTTAIDLDDIVFAEADRKRRVSVEISGVSAGRIAGRADEFATVVSHLLDNAARHADQRVSVGLVSMNGRVLLTVDDDGPGIAVDDRVRVFERFTRLDDARDRDRGGAGLGLAVVASAVERSGGTVRVEPSPLGGARFVVDVPAAHSCAEDVG